MRERDPPVPSPTEPPIAAAMSEMTQSATFFDKFGETSRKRSQQCRQELAAEYAEFKLQDEAKFANRFKDKKQNDSAANNDHSTIGNSSAPARRGNMVTVQKHSPPRRMSISPQIESRNQPSSTTDALQLEDRLLDLAQQVERLTASVHRSSTPSFPHPPPMGYPQFDRPMAPMYAMSNSAYYPPGYIEPAPRPRSYDQEEFNRKLEALRETQERLTTLERHYANFNLNQRHQHPNAALPDLDSSRFMDPRTYADQMERKIERHTSPIAASQSGLKFPPINPTHTNYPIEPRRQPQQSPTIIPNLIEALPQPNSSTIDDREKKAQYALELQKQMEEAKLKKKLQKQTDLECDRKLEAKWANGVNYATSAPDIKLQDQIKTEVSDSTSETPPVTTASEPVNHSRGGHGIFGQPLTDAQKYDLASYKADLKQQIEAKQREKAEQRQREEESERREAAKVAADCERMQREYKAERELLQQHQAKQKAAETAAKESAIDSPKDELPTEIKIAPSIAQQEVPVVKKRRPRVKREERTAVDPSSTTRVTERYTPSKERSCRQSRDDSEASSIDVSAQVRNQPVLKQLTQLRSQLELEKREAGIVLQQYQVFAANSRDDDSHNVDRKRHPKVAKRVTKIFNKKSRPTSQTNNHSKEPDPTVPEETGLPRLEIDDLTSSASTVTALEGLENKQLSYLVKQDERLDRLRINLSELDEQETQNDAILAENTSLIVSDSTFILVPDFEPLSLTPPRDADQSSLAGDWELDELVRRTADRRERLKSQRRAEGQLDIDSELELQMFVDTKEHQQADA